MFAGVDPSGLYITVENNSNVDIKDLVYLVDQTVHKVKEIKKENEAKIYIFTANFPKEHESFISNPIQIKDSCSQTKFNLQILKDYGYMKTIPLFLMKIILLLKRKIILSKSN